MFSRQSWYDIAMRLPKWQQIVTRSAVDVVNAFDVRLAIRPYRTRATTAKAWQTAGAYVGEALANYGRVKSQSHTTR